MLIKCEIIWPQEGKKENAVIYNKMNKPQDIMLSEISSAQKDKCRVTPLISLYASRNRIEQ